MYEYAFRRGQVLNGEFVEVEVYLEGVGWHHILIKLDKFSAHRPEDRKYFRRTVRRLAEILPQCLKFHSLRYDDLLDAHIGDFSLHPETFAPVDMLTDLLRREGLGIYDSLSASAADQDVFRAEARRRCDEKWTSRRFT